MMISGTDNFEREIFITLQIPGTHCWPKAKKSAPYLKHEHRHLFIIRVGSRVEHNDRHIEFMALRTVINDHLMKRWNKRLGLMQLGSMSCEALAQELLEKFEYLNWVEVSEDGENGAWLSR